MNELIKPFKLSKGDKVATVSLAWGGAGDEDIIWRYNQGKNRLIDIFRLNIVEMPHTLKGTAYLYNHPEKRAEDLMAAFQDDSIKAIFCCIGGEDSIRMLPFIDFDIIKNNPKIFMGYSDNTVAHFICMKAGISSFYGPSILTDFAENIEVPEYTINAMNKTLFSNEIIGEIKPSDIWTAEHLEWKIENKFVKRKFEINSEYELLQGKGIIKGRLIGGCLEVINTIRGTSLFPPTETFDNCILFLETCEVFPPCWYIEDTLRTFGAMGILERISGIFWGKPQSALLYDEYKESIKRVLNEFGCGELPVLYNGSFAHNEPMTILPYGVMAEINCEDISFAILENAVI